MNNHDIGQSFDKLLRNIFYEYAGIRCELMNDGSVVYKGQPMALVDFHRLVDNKYDALESSIASIETY